MKTVVILPSSENGKSFRAVSGEKESFGMTIGEALDALTVQFENSDSETLFIVQRFQPDEFFTAEQQKRLSQLMENLRQAEAENREMNPKEREELEGLIDAELEGSANRVAKIADKFGK